MMWGPKAVILISVDNHKFNFQYKLSYVIFLLLFIKVCFCQKITMFLSKLQTNEHFSFPKLKILILVTENCLELKDVLLFESLEPCKGKKVAFGC